MSNTEDYVNECMEQLEKDIKWLRVKLICSLAFLSVTFAFWECCL